MMRRRKKLRHASPIVEYVATAVPKVVALRIGCRMHSMFCFLPHLEGRFFGLLLQGYGHTPG
jgi:hypothetical protein